MIHRVKLYLLSRRNSILLFIGMTTIITTLVLVFASLVHLHNQSTRNEQILKGLSCILLILPENRTQEKVANCIRVNNADNAEFLFKTLSDPEQADVTMGTLEDKTLLVVPIKGDTGPQGPQGDKGQDGVSIKGDKGETVVVKGDVGPQGEPGAPAREVELNYNVEKAQFEWRYVGDDGWQVLVKQCVLTNSCPEEPSTP